MILGDILRLSMGTLISMMIIRIWVMERLIISTGLEGSLGLLRRFRMFIWLNRSSISNWGPLSIVSFNTNRILICNMEMSRRLIRKVILIKLRLMFRSIRVFSYLTIKWFLLRIIRFKIKDRSKISKNSGSIIRTHCLKVTV